MKRFDNHQYKDDQIIEALTCPVNRHCTRVEHNCDDWELFKHPEWLMMHFIENGGAKEFTKRRGNKKYWVKQEESRIVRVKKLGKLIIHPIRYHTVVLRIFVRLYSWLPLKRQKSE